VLFVYSFLLERKGNTVHLLKTKSKAVPQHRQRKQVQVMTTLADFQGP
jgi:hypothetical protein